MYLSLFLIARKGTPETLKTSISEFNETLIGQNSTLHIGQCNPSIRTRSSIPKFTQEKIHEHLPLTVSTFFQFSLSFILNVSWIILLITE